MEKEEKDYLWEHFVFNAEQRLKAFNFFVVFSVFANGGVFAAVDKKLPPIVFVLIGGFVLLLSVVFWMIDARSRALLQLAIPGLIEYERRLDERSRLFAKDNDPRRKKRWIRYTVAFGILFALQALFGLGVIGYGICQWF